MNLNHYHFFVVLSPIARKRRLSAMLILNKSKAASDSHVNRNKLRTHFDPSRKLRVNVTNDRFKTESSPLKKGAIKR
jgi:hypothetical protein